MSKLNRFCGCIIVLLMIAIGINKINFWVRPTGADGALEQVETFHSLPKDSVDVVVYGSSHAFSGLNVMDMYDKYGIGAYNYGYNWQMIDTTRLFLIDSLLTQKPKIALIETYMINEVHEDCDLDPQIYYTRYLNCRSDVNLYLKKCFGNNLERWVTYYMPLWMFHDNWTNIGQNLIKFQYPDGVSKLSSMGSQQNHVGFNECVLSEQDKNLQVELSDSAIEELDSIVKICKDHNVKVLFFTTPCEGQYLYSSAVSEYAKANGCQYINIFDHIEEIGIDEKKDFYDSGHLNLNGSIKVADYMGSYIKQNYDILDIRNVDNNIWESNLEDFHKLIR